MKTNISTFIMMILFCCLGINAQDKIYGPEDPPPFDYTLIYNGTLNDSEIGETQGKTLFLSQFVLAATTDVYFATVQDEVKISLDGEDWSPNEILQFNAGLSDLPNGILVWTGSTNLSGDPTTVYTKFTLVAKEQVTGNPIPMIESTPITGSSYAGGVIQISESLAFQVNLRFDAGYNQANLQPALEFYDLHRTYTNAFSSYDYGIFWVNDAPRVEGVSALQVNEGETAWLSVDNLLVSDAESGDADVHIILSPEDPQQPEYGTLYAGNTALAGDDSFTLDQLKSGTIHYTHDDSETTSDNLAFLVMDGDGKYYFNEGENSQVVNIPVEITPMNDPPMIITLEALQAMEGEAVPITAQFLATEDNESDAEHITYTFDPDTEGEWPKAGVLQLGGVPINSGDQFTQADIDQENLSYTNLGAEIPEDGFYFSVEDEIGTKPDDQQKFFFEIAITMVNDPPVLSVNSPTEAEQWGEILIDENQLAASDEESDAAHITFTLEPGVMVTDYGSLYLDQTQLGPEDVFTMQDILDGKLKYVNNGSAETTDAIVVSISDEEGALASDAGFTVFTHRINITLTDIEAYQNKGFFIYPNPGTGIFKIRWTGDFDSYALYNVLGERLISGYVSGMREMELDLRDMENGVMFIRMSGADPVIVRRLVKVRH